MFKIKKRFMLFITCLLILSSINNNYATSKNIYSTNNLVKKTLLAQIPNENISLYALDSDKGKGIYENILLEVKGKQKKFNWIVDSGLPFRPEIMLRDINNDSKKELIIITTKWEGTDHLIQEIHIFDVDSLEEIIVDDPLNIVNKNVKSSIDKNKHKIYITIGNKKSKIEYIDYDYKVLGNNVYFANKILYEVKDDIIYVKLGANVTGIGYFGIINIQYKFKNNMLIYDKIGFEKFKDLSNIK